MNYAPLAITSVIACSCHNLSWLTSVSKHTVKISFRLIMFRLHSPFLVSWGDYFTHIRTSERQHSYRGNRVMTPVHLNTLRSRQNGRHFPDDIFRWIFLNENVWISLKFSLKFLPRFRINNIPPLVQIMAWRRLGDKPLSGPMMVSLPTHICVTRPQWVKKAWSIRYVTLSLALKDRSRNNAPIGIFLIRMKLIEKTYSFYAAVPITSALMLWQRFNGRESDFSVHN